MKNFLILFLLCFLSLKLSSQRKIVYEEVLKDLKTDYKSLQTTLIIPNIEFHVGIYPQHYDVEDLTKEQCGDIKTDYYKNKKIIEILNNNSLLEELYLDGGDSRFVSINSNKYFNENDVFLFLQLNFDNGKSGVYQVFIPIKKRDKSKKIIKLISDIFEYKFCFKKLKRKI